MELLGTLIQMEEIKQLTEQYPKGSGIAVRQNIIASEGILVASKSRPQKLLHVHCMSSEQRKMHTDHRTNQSQLKYTFSI